MRVLVALVVVAGCGFDLVAGSSPPPSDTGIDVVVVDVPAIDVAPPIDARIDAPADPCGVVPGQVVVVDPATAWEVSANNGATWTATTLPDTNWPCDNCTRLFRTTVCGRPSAISFRFSSDNRARMRVDNAVVYDEYWIAGYCTDQPCCDRCCDSATTCAARLSSMKQLSLLQFTTGTNTLVWEVSEEGGGSGFHTLMTLTY